MSIHRRMGLIHACNNMNETRKHSVGKKKKARHQNVSIKMKLYSRQNSSIMTKSILGVAWDWEIRCGVRLTTKVQEGNFE